METMILSKFQMLIIDVLFSMCRCFTNKEWFYATIDAQDALEQPSDYVWWESQMIGVKVQLTRMGIIRHIGEESGVNIYWRTTTQKPSVRERNVKERYRPAYSYQRVRWQAESLSDEADYPMNADEATREAASDMSTLARMMYADLGDKKMADAARISYAAKRLGDRLDYAYNRKDMLHPSAHLRMKMNYIQWAHEEFAE